MRSVGCARRLNNHDARPRSTSTTVSPTIRVCARDSDYAAWDRFVSNLPGAHYYQTYGWLKSYEPIGLRTHVLVYERGDTIQGGVAFLSAKVPLLTWRIFIVSHGPLPPDPDSPGWLPLMNELEKYCRSYNGIRTTIYPHEFENSRALLARLEALGYSAPGSFTSHRFNSTPVTIALAGKHEADILNACRPRTRSSIRRALAGEMTMRTRVDRQIFDKIYSLLSEHGEARGYHPRPYASLKAAWEWFAPRGETCFFQAWLHNTLVGAILIVFTGRTGYFLAGATRREYSDLRPSEFLHWHAICEAIRREMIAYDFTSLEDSGGGVFKTGFRPVCSTWQRPRTKIYHPVQARVMDVTEHHFSGMIRILARYRSLSRPFSLGK